MAQPTGTVENSSVLIINHPPQQRDERLELLYPLDHSMSFQIRMENYTQQPRFKMDPQQTWTGIFFFFFLAAHR